MLEQISPLWDVFTTKQQLDEPLVLATLVKTTGSSYKKSGAMMLIEANKKTHGLLSGGCLEADVAEHALLVFEGKEAITLHYDMSDESVFGLGAGCDGTLQVVLQLLSGDYLPFSALDPYQPSQVNLHINAGELSDLPVGSFCFMKNNQWHESVPGTNQALLAATTALIFTPPPKVAVCGAGIDVSPLLDILHLLQWHVYLIDHRSGRLKTEAYPAKTHLITASKQELGTKLDAHNFDAAIIMTHNVERDANYLRHFSQTMTPWLGLLGPVKRRNKVLQQAGIEFKTIETRLHSPIGLNIGGHMPENIAVSIVAQLQQHFN